MQGVVDRASVISGGGRPLWQALLVFQAPIVLSGLLASVSQTAAYTWVGRLISSEALAAMAVAMPLAALMTTAILALASGCNILVAQAAGAHDRARVRRIAGTALGAAFAAGSILAACATLIAPPLLKLLATPPSIWQQTESLTIVLLWAAPLLFPYLVYITIVRGTGDSKTPLYSLLISLSVAIVTPPAFILGWWGLPKLNVVSVGVASIVANAIGFASLAVFVYVRGSVLRFDRAMLPCLRIDVRVLWQIVRLGAPIGLQSLIMVFAQVAVLSFVNRFGADATAAWGAVGQIMTYAQIPMTSVGMAAAIFCGQLIGSNRQVDVPEVTRAAIIMNYVFGGAIVAAGYLASVCVLQLFLTDARTLHLAVGILDAVLWSSVLYGHASVLMNIMRSSGTVLAPALISAGTVIAVELPLAYMLMPPFGLKGVVAAFPVTFVCALCVTLFYYRIVWKGQTHKRLAL